MQYTFFVIVLLLLTAFMAVGTYRSAQILRWWTPDRNLILLPGDNLVRVGLILLCVGLGVLSGLPRATLGWTADRALLQIGLGVVVGVALAFFFYVTTRGLTRRTGERFYSAVIVDHIVPKARREWVLVALAMVGVALLEELLFRSLLIGGLSPLLPAWVLVLGVGILFGVMHLPQGLWGMAGAASAGVIFGLLFLLSGSLLAPLAAHYAANMAQITWAMRDGERSPRPGAVRTDTGQDDAPPGVPEGDDPPGP